MSRRVLPLIGLLGLLACEPGDPQIDISVTMSPVIAAEAARAIVVLFPAAPPTTCEILRLSEKNTTDPLKIGTYRSTVTLPAAPPHEANFFDLVPGDYQIAVFVYDDQSELVGFGCQMAPVEIELGKRAESSLIEVRSLPSG